MQNQDPTADTDPNEYINQLVQVNSLEQLIDINQTLTRVLTARRQAQGMAASGQIAGATSGTPGSDSPESSTVLQRISARARPAQLPAIASESRLGGARPRRSSRKSQRSGCSMRPRSA